MGWWIALGVIFLLGILPLGISARYSGEGPLLRVDRPRPADPVPPKKEGEKAKTCEKNGGTAEKTGRTSPKAAPAPQAGACGG